MIYLTEEEKKEARRLQCIKNSLKWNRKNREYYNKYHREYYARKKAEKEAARNGMEENA